MSIVLNLNYSKSVRKILQRETSEPLEEYKKALSALIIECLDIVNDPTTVNNSSTVVSSNSNNIASTKIKNPSATTSSKKPTTNNKKSTSKKRSSATIDSDDEDNSNKSTKKIKKTPKKRNIDEAKIQKNPFTKSWLLSSTLSDVVGVKTLSRPGVVKALWVYIKANNLQDPANKQNILCDDKLKRVFEGEDKVNCFTMNKYIGKHLSDLPEGYLEQNKSE
ncbi:unnamed protein product [Cunninghamella echinulata]